MSDEKLMTVQEFNLQVTKWAMKVRAEARATLGQNTHASGRLATMLSQFVDKMGADEPAYKIKFSFERYGVYRAYGVGRGYVMVNGILTRGFRARSDREIRNRQWNIYTTDLTNKGYTVSQINRAKYTPQGVVLGKGKERTPLDWIDQHINSSIAVLADYVQKYYGDVALQQMLDNFGKMRIVKKG